MLVPVLWVFLIVGLIAGLQDPKLDETLLLHMMWTTSSFTFQALHLHVLHRYFHHHPALHAKLYIKDPNWVHWHAHLGPLLRRGYHIEVVPITDAFLEGLVEQAPCKTAAEWIHQRGRFQDGRFYYSHLTDFLRFCVLALEGGIYSDFDALLLRPLPMATWFPAGSRPGRVVVGKDRVGQDEACSWCLADGRTYLAPGLMVAEPGSPLLQAALCIGFNVTRYDPEVFNLVGPQALTAAARTVPKSQLLSLNRDSFYPVDYKEAAELFKERAMLQRLGETAQIVKERIERRAISLHFFGAQTRQATIESDSVMDLITRQLPLDNRDGGMVGPDYLVVKAWDEWTPLGDGVRWSSENLPRTISLGIKGGAKVSPGNCAGATVAELNRCLARAKMLVPSTDETEPILSLIIGNGVEVVDRIPIYNLQKLLTVTVKTMDRMHKVVELVSSLRQFYPRVPVMVSNDGEAAFSIDEGIKRGNFEYVPLKFDVGLSAARNLMLQRTKSPLVMILDDDFEFGVDSDVGYLVHQLVTHKVAIVAASSPEDQSAHGIEYAGLLDHEIATKTLSIKTGDRGGLPNSSCTLVDIVPNIFVARTLVLRDLGWDEELKLGEHEEFFLRARRRSVRIATCRSVTLGHRQEPHWLNRTAYDRLRSRVWRFLQHALEKHHLRRLVAFGVETMALQPLIIESISNVRIFDLQPFSVHFTWNCATNYHYYQVDVFDMSHCQTEDDPGVFHHDQAVEPSLRSPQTPTHALVTGLDPDCYYRLVLRPGNHTDLHPDGAELIIRTPPYHSPANLILNGDFDGSDQYWERSLGTQSGLVPLHNHGMQAVDSIPARPGHHALQALGHPLGDYAASLVIAAGPPTSHPHPNLVSLYQDIPIAELPEACWHGPCQLSASAWTRIDRLFGPPRLLSIALCIGLVGCDHGEKRWCEEFDPYEETKWQMIAFSIGINLAADAGASIESIRLSVWLRAPRGAAFFDDFYLAARPIPTTSSGFL